MKKMIQLPAIMVVGITARTNNAAEMDPAIAKIGKTFQKFFTHYQAKIKNRKKPGTVFAVYTDYETDASGDYTYFVGEEVTAFDPNEQGLECLTIMPAHYVRLSTEPGRMPAVVINVWEKIWNMGPSDLGGERTYKADFEQYDERSKDPNNTVVDVYVGIQK